MAECRWCGEEFEPGIWPEHCSEGCLENDMESTWDPERRLKLQAAFDRWLDQQEKEMEERSREQSSGI